MQKVTNLVDKIALITGGAQGLGKGFAQAVLNKGGSVSLLDVNTDVGLKTEEQFKSKYGAEKATFIKCDVSQKQELEAAFRQTRDMFGNLDLVVNNAGIPNEDQWEDMIQINLAAVIRGSYLAMNYMEKEKGGHGGIIINIASTAGFLPVPFGAAYSATKHGVVGFSRSLALQLSDIRVACMCPSFADTAIIGKAKGLKTPLGQQLIDSIGGLMTVDYVVKGFLELVNNEDNNGGVLSVTPQGMKYKYPKGLSLSKL